MLCMLRLYGFVGGEGVIDRELRKIVGAKGGKGLKKKTGANEVWEVVREFFWGIVETNHGR